MRLVAALALLAFAAMPSAAQLRGTVRDSTSGLPVPGAVVIAFDAAGEQVARNVTSERGEFALRGSRAAKRLQVLRIGFRPRTVESPASENTRVDIVVVAIPTLLQPLNVVDQPNCPRRDDSPAAFALWEQAKSGLLATVVAREENPAHVVRLHFDRRIDRGRDTANWMEVRVDSAMTSSPFAAARAAAAFIERGFVDDSGGAKVFHAPDAAVLLDATFPRGYCFEIAKPDAARPHQVGLGFRAARTRAGRVDVAGTIWIDTTARSLTDIVYRYAGLDARFDRARAGGLVSFRTMPNGTVLIDRWHIRLLAALRGAKTGPAGTIGRGDDYEIHEKGGQVASARWPDGHTWNASLGTLIGQAWYRTRPAAGAHLRLFETSYDAVVDSTGRFEISQLLPGPYSVGVIDPILDSLSITLRTGVAFTAVRDSTTRVSFNVPTAGDYLIAACEALGVSGVGRFALIGQIVDPAGGLAHGAEYRVYRRGSPDRHPIWAGQADERGTFVVCSVEHGDVLDIVAKYSGFLGSADYHVDRRVGTVRVHLQPGKSR